MIVLAALSVGQDTKLKTSISQLETAKNSFQTSNAKNLCECAAKNLKINVSHLEATKMSV